MSHRRAVLWLGCWLLAVIATPAAARPPLSLLPEPVKIEQGRGELAIDTGAAIFVAPQDAAARRVAEAFTEIVRRQRGLVLPIRSEDTATARIEFAIDPRAPVTRDEGYSLRIDSRQARVTARGEAGLYYGAITLAQLLSGDEGQGAVHVPALRIEDWPRFAWRGVMLDVARHYMPVAEIERLLDAMALHKLNVFHWHLTDDQGWRLQIRRYPQLTEIGAWRDSPVPGPDGKAPRYGGWYTQDEVRRIVAYAAARHIAVVPEIDMPGHAQAAVAAMPEVGVPGIARPPVSADWGVHPYLYGPQEETFTFIENVLAEVMELFPSTYIHVGGDEAIRDQWQASAAVQARMRALGIENEHALQSWFIARIGRYLAAHGRRLIGWDEILEGGLPQSGTVMSWRGTDGAIAAAKLGHDVVLAPSPVLYLDHLESRDSDEPAGRLAPQTLADVYAFEAVPRELDAKQARHVLGTQVNLWTEYKSSPALAFRAIFPRASALAERAWSPAARRDWPGFVRRLPAQLARLQNIGVTASDAAYAAEFAARPADHDRRVTVTLANQAGYGAIRYTLDGSEPTPQSPRYAAPLQLTPPVRVGAAAYEESGRRLANVRARDFGAQTDLVRRSAQLQACRANGIELRVPLRPDAADMSPLYDVELFDACWIWRDAQLDDIGGAAIDAATLAWNFQLAHDAASRVLRPSPNGAAQLELRIDGCDGETLSAASLPASAAPAGARYALTLDWAPRQGRHDLCMRFNGVAGDRLPALEAVRLLPR